jgi:hypothetical protein
MATAFSDRVVQCAEFFDSMLNLIPVVYYYPSDQPDEENDNENEKFVHNKKAAAGDLSVGKKKRKGAPQIDEKAEISKFEAATKKRAKVEHRQDLFDPANYQTVVTIQSANLHAAPPAAKQLNPKYPAPSTPALEKDRESKKALPIPSVEAPAAVAGTLEELRARLHQRIASLQTGRKPESTKQEHNKTKQPNKTKAMSASKEEAKKKLKGKPATSPATIHESEPMDTDDLDFTFGAVKTDEKKGGKRDKKRESDVKALKKAEAFRDYLTTLEVENPEKAKELKQQKAIEVLLLVDMCYICST